MRRVFPITWVLTLLLSLQAAPPCADGATLEDARTLFFTGEYERAAAALEAILKNEPASEPAASLLVELELELGRFEDAARRCETFLRRVPRATRVRAAYAQVLHRRGDFEEAHREAHKVEILDPDCLKARFLKALVRHERGDRLAAKRLFETFIDVWQDTPHEKLSAEDVTMIGLACTYYALADRNAKMLKTIVNTVYPLALKKDKRHTPALIASGELFLEKYNTDDARKDFQSALRINPRHPLALVGLARCELGRRRFVEAQEFLERAAQIAPQLPEVLLLDATLSIYDEDYQEALETAEKVLRQNPTRPEALGIKAACLRHLERSDECAAVEQQVLSVNPKCSIFYETTASVLIARHRDGEAEPLLRKAVELSPNDSRPAALLGLLLMRQGKEQEAHRVLEEAHQADSFNVLVYNSLNLLDGMKDFEVRRTEHFTIKVHPKADRVLIDYVADYLEEIYPELVARYQHEVPHTLVEIFPDHRMFSVRTTGVPNVGTVGACLGPTIVMDSPSVGRPGMFSWATVLRHEFTHVVTLSATDMKIAHWFTEALAVTEERQPRPCAWRQLLVDALEADELMPVTKLNHGFTRARTARRRQLAYAQSHLIAEFVTEKWGAGKLVDMLGAYRRLADTAQVITSVFDMTPEAFDEAFRAYAERVVQGYNLPPRPLVREQDEVEKGLEESPKDAELQWELARIKLARRDLTGAALAALESLRFNPASARAHATLGAVRLRQKNTKEAQQAFEKALQLDPREVTAVRGLVAIHRLRKDDTGALEYLKTLRALEPQNPSVCRALAHLQLKGNDQVGAVESLVKAAELDSQDYASRRELARLMTQRSDYATAAKYIDQAIAIWPYDRGIHEWGARVFAELGRPERAKREKALIPYSKPYRGGPRVPAEGQQPVEH